MSRKLRHAVLCMAIILAAITAPAQASMEFGIRGGLVMATQTTENTGLVLTIREREPWYPVYTNYTDDYAASTHTGFQMGAFLTCKLGNRLSIQPELIYTERGIEVEGLSTYREKVPYYQDSIGVTYKEHITQTIEFTCLDISVLTRIGILSKGKLRTSLLIGPALAFTFSGRNRYDVQATQSAEGFPESTYHFYERRGINNLNSPDASLVLGGDVRLAFGSVSLVMDLRYTMGLSNAFKDVGIERTLYNYNDGFPGEFPVAHFWTGKASDAKNRAFSFTLGVSFPM